MERTTNASVLKARELRRSMSPPEHLLWQALRARPAGLKFRRQHPLGPYVADFYCPALKLVIEVDGYTHGTADHPARDARRDGWMRREGIAVLRFTASDVIRAPESLVTAITHEARRLLPLHHASHGPPPPASRGEA